MDRHTRIRELLGANGAASPSAPASIHIHVNVNFKKSAPAIPCYAKKTEVSFSDSERGFKKITGPMSSVDNGTQKKLSTVLSSTTKDIDFSSRNNAASVSEGGVLKNVFLKRCNLHHLEISVAPLLNAGFLNVAA